MRIGPSREAGPHTAKHLSSPARGQRDAAGTRPYRLYVPASYRGQPVPLLVMLHGCTQSPEDFAAGTRMSEVAEKERFLVAYPGQIVSANPAKCWNWFSPNDQSRDRGEPSMIAGITRLIIGEYAIDRNRVYVAGMSAGGAAAAIMGDTYPDLYAAIGIHSGLPCGSATDLQSALSAMKHGGTGSVEGFARLVPAIVFHGSEDRTVHPDNADAVIDQLVAANEEHVGMLNQLERAYDEASEESLGLGQSSLPSGDELAAELERYLREQGD